MKAVTDPKKLAKDDPADPNVCMVYYYHQLVTDKEQTKTICEECKKGQRGCVQCKKELIDSLNQFLTPIREKRKYYDEHQEEVEKILKDGTSAAREKAKETMEEVRKKMKINY